MKNLHTKFLFSSIALIVAVSFLAGCGATDQVKEATRVTKAGLSTAGYLKEIQPQLTQYSTVIGTVNTQPPHNPAKGKVLHKTSSDLKAIAAELKAIEPAKEYKAAHADLIKSVDESAAVVEKMAKAADASNQAEFNRLLTNDYATAQEKFATAMSDATKPLADAANSANK